MINEIISKGTELLLIDSILNTQHNVIVADVSVDFDPLTEFPIQLVLSFASGYHKDNVACVEWFSLGGYSLNGHYSIQSLTKGI